ncbi:MAG: 50S ribosomal protein L25 [Thermoleophilaceae bacterium]
MADSDRPSLTLTERGERGSRAARRLRREGYVPGVLYGGENGDSVSFKVGDHELRRVLQDGAALLDVSVGSGKPLPVIVKDQQQHPVRGEVLHLDLLQVKLDETIQTTVALELEGSEESPGVKEGGVLEQVTHELNIEALPTDIPERIVADVSAMEVAATLTLADISIPPKVEVLDDPEETTIATVVVPTEVEEPEIEEETELIGEDGEPIAVDEEGEPIEGEPGEEGAPAEGEQPSEAPEAGGGDDAKPEGGDES